MSSFGSRSYPFRVSPPRPKAGPVLAIGSRASISCATGSSDNLVSLRDHADHSTVATVAGGVDVEIVAWQPHRTDGTRYRVRVLDAPVEGWVVSGRLKAHPRPIPPPVVHSAVEAARPPVRKPRAASGASRRAPATVKAAAAPSLTGPKVAVPKTALPVAGRAVPKRKG